MNASSQDVIREACQVHDNDRTRLLDIALAVQERLGCVGLEAVDQIAGQLGCPRVEVEGIVSFYAFLNDKPRGQVVIRLCNDVIDRLKGVDEVAAALRVETGIDFGQTTPDGKISLEFTPCIGMSDQAPAALVNDVVVTDLSSDQARAIVRRLREDPDPTKLVGRLGDGNNADDRVRAMVHNNIRLPGKVVFTAKKPGAGVRAALAMSPVEVINAVKTSRLRGRGGAGFPTGMKWEFARAAEGEKKYVICNADEGEPGTFKDRVILTERPGLLLAGMAIAGYAVGSDTGILYLRGEYAYLRHFLEDTIAQRRKAGLLGKNIAGRKGFCFDVRIQMGAGSYICGEETALITSCEGVRGDPKNRPPFPAQQGFMDCPTVVNNVETFCKVARILEKGPGWFAKMGSRGSAGTKLLSISGDCSKPGVYEIPFGVTLTKVLSLCGAEDTAAVQMGGPSGQMVGPADFDRPVCYDHLATGGAVMVFNSRRNLLEIAAEFLDFFIEESCGYCTPCRVGNVLLRERLERFLAGTATIDDIDYLQTLGQSVKTASRCGLGQTSPNPVLSTLKNFRPLYEAAAKTPDDGRDPSFDIRAALAGAETIVGRKSVCFTD